MFSRKSAIILCDKAITLSLVGKVLKMTTMSATVWPFMMVAFLKDPTTLTSSICNLIASTHYSLRMQLQQANAAMTNLTYGYFGFAWGYNDVVQYRLYLGHDSQQGRMVLGSGC